MLKLKNTENEISSLSSVLFGDGFFKNVFGEDDSCLSKLEQGLRRYERYMNANKRPIV